MVRQVVVIESCSFGEVTVFNPIGGGCCDDLVVGRVPAVGHVFIRLSGFGMRLVPYWPYEFARTGETADSVRVTHWSGAGPVSATVDRRQLRSVEGVVDVLPGPDHEHWLAETGMFGFQWPEGFDLGVTAAEDDDKPFYLFGPDDAQIFSQGPVATQRLPDAAGWTASGQTLVAQHRVDVVADALGLPGRSW